MMQYLALLIDIHVFADLYLAVVHFQLSIVQIYFLNTGYVDLGFRRKLSRTGMLSLPVRFGNNYSSCLVAKLRCLLVITHKPMGLLNVFTALLNKCFVVTVPEHSNNGVSC